MLKTTLQNPSNGTADYTLPCRRADRLGPRHRLTSGLISASVFFAAWPILTEIQ